MSPTKPIIDCSDHDQCEIYFDLEFLLWLRLIRINRKPSTSSTAKLCIFQIVSHQLSIKENEIIVNDIYQLLELLGIVYRKSIVISMHFELNETRPILKKIKNRKCFPGFEFIFISEFSSTIESFQIQHREGKEGFIVRHDLILCNLYI